MDDKVKAHRAILAQAQKLLPELTKEPETFTFADKSATDYLNMEVPTDSNLVGNRWLTRDGSAVIVAPSHHGKSSFCMALMVNFAIGRIVFGLKPAKAWRVLLLESEDDVADLKRFLQVISVMDLSEDQIDTLNANTRIEYRRDLTGERFIAALDSFLAAWPADIVIINPITGFYTGSTFADEQIVGFLRASLNPLMEKHKCAPILVAHMPKKEIPTLQSKEWYEWMYSIAGGAAWANWARAIIAFAPTKERGTYRFVAAKRFAETGWTEPEIFLSHKSSLFQSNGCAAEVLQWVPSTDSQIEQAQPVIDQQLKRRDYSALDVYKKMSPIELYSRDQFREWCKSKFNLGVNRSDIIRSALVDDGLIEVIETVGKGFAKNRLFKKSEPTT